jgi:X-X-X-Leu-X-X-Gly heptad repeat protein
MTGIISTYAVIFFVSQLGAPPFAVPSAAPGSGQLGSASGSSNVNGVSDGWKIDRDNTLTYIVQLSPQMATDIATRGEEIKIPIPTNLQGIAENVLIRIGNAQVERELTDDQLRSRQQQRLRSDTRNAGITDLNSLSSRSSGGVVPIDPQRSPAAILPTGNSSASARSTENDLAMQVPFGSPPSLGASRFATTPSETLPPQTIPSSQQTLPPTVPPSFTQSNLGAPSGIANNGLNSNGTTQFADGFNSLRNGLNQAANNSMVNSNGYTNQLNGTTTPSNYTSTSTANGNFPATQSTPYTGGNVTVLGTPAIDRIATNPYGTNQTTSNPFGSTFGATNPYAPTGTTTNWNNQSSYGQQQPLGPLNGQYANQLNSQSPSQYLPSTVPMPSLQNSLGTNAWMSDPRNSTAGYTDSYRTSQQNSSYLPPGYDSNTTTLPPYARLAQSSTSLSGTGLRESPLSRELNLDVYGNPIATKQGRDTLSGLGQLLLVISLVGNAYLIWQLNNLFNSYRTLQLSKRAEGSYSLDL